MKYLPLLWAALWRKKARTIFTLFSIIVAFLLFGMLQGVNSAIHRGIDMSNVNRLNVFNRYTFTEPLPFAYLTQLEAVTGVDAVAYATWFGSYYQDPKNFVFSFPVDPQRYFDMYPELKVDKAQLEALEHTRDGALVGFEAMQKYGWKIGDRIPLNSMIWTKSSDGNSVWNFEIMGIFDNSADRSQTNSVLFNHDYFDEARAFGKGTVGWYVVRLKDPTHAATVAATIDKMFANSANETKTQTEKESAQGFIKQFGDIGFMMNAIIGAVFFTLLFLTGNTMMQSVRERVPELAVLKTLGFTDNTVFGLVVAESLLLCVLAAALGLGLAQLLFPALKNFIGVATLPPRVTAAGFGMAILLALVIGAIPALRAQRLNIVDALAGR